MYNYSNFQLPQNGFAQMTKCLQKITVNLINHLIILSLLTNKRCPILFNICVIYYLLLHYIQHIRHAQLGL